MTLQIISFLSFALGVFCFSCAQLAQHGKFIIDSGFWDAASWKRKYKVKWISSKSGDLPDLGQFIPAPKNWYYKLIGSKYKERWFTSTWLTVNLTDGYHACQSAMFILFSISISLLSGVNVFIIWCSLLVVHFLTYKLLQR